MKASDLQPHMIIVHRDDNGKIIQKVKVQDIGPCSQQRKVHINGRLCYDQCTELEIWEETT